MSRLIGPQRERRFTGGRAAHVISRTPRTCSRCNRIIPAGTRHVVLTATPSYAADFGYGRHWLTDHVHGESPRACPHEEAS